MTFFLNFLLFSDWSWKSGRNTTRARRIRTTPEPAASFNTCTTNWPTSRRLSTTTTRKPSPRKRASQQFTSSHSFGFPSLCCNRWRKLNYLTEEQKWNYINEEKKEFGRLRKSSTFVGQCTHKCDGMIKHFFFTLRSTVFNMTAFFNQLIPIYGQLFCFFCIIC